MFPLQRLVAWMSDDDIDGANFNAALTAEFGA